MTIGAIALLSGDKPQTIEKALEGLKNKGLVSRVDGVVAVYRAVPPSLMMGEDLSSAAAQTSSLTDASRTAFDSYDETLTEVVQTITDAERSMSAELSRAFDESESILIGEEQAGAASSIASSSEVMRTFCEAAESLLKDYGESLDQGLVSLLADLQSDLDKAQNDIQMDIKTLSKEFDQEVRGEQDASSQAIAEFGKKTKAMVQKARSTVNGALVDNLETLRQTIDGLSVAIESRTSDTVKESTDQLAASSDELARSLEQIVLELDQTGTETRKSLSGVASISREAAGSIAKSARQAIENALRVVQPLAVDVGSWTEESTSSIAFASEGLAAQLGQVASTNSGYLEAMKNTLSMYLGQTDSVLNQAFVGLSDLLSGMKDQIESFSGEARASTTKLAQAQVSASRDRIDSAATSFGAGLDKWTTDTGRSLQKKTAQASSEASASLDAEAAKLSSLVGELSTKLSSAFGSVMSTTAETDKLIVSGTKKAVREFETGIDNKLTEITSDMTSAASTHIQESGAFYRGLRSSLDSRLEQSVSSLASHAERMQKQIDDAIEDQTARTERQTEAIRKEFRARLDEIAKEHSEIAQSLGSVFGGLLSSQGLETHDLISSAHTQFRNAVKAEITSLQDDSAKLKKEYASEIEGKVAKVSVSYEAMKKALEEPMVQRRSALSRSVADLLGRIEATTADIERGLQRIESGTIREMAETLAQASAEFSESIGAARDSFGSRIGSITDSATESLTKSTTGLKATLDEYVSGEKDAQQRFLADVGKKLDTLSSKVVRDLLLRTESSEAELTAHMEEAIKTRTATNEEGAVLLESQMAEDERVFSEFSEYVNSVLSGTSSSLASLSKKLTEEVGQMQRGLTKASEHAETSLVQRSEVGIKHFEEAAIGVIERAENSFKEKTAALGSACNASLDNSSQAVAGLPSSLSDISRSAINEALTQIESSNSEVVGSLSTDFVACETASKSTTDDVSRDIERLKGAMTKSVGSFSERTKQSIVAFNQRSSKKMDSARKGVRTQIVSASGRVTENLRTEASSKEAEITRIAEQVRGQLEESTGRAKETRTQALDRFGIEMEGAVEKWHVDIGGCNTELRQRIEQTIQQLESVVSKTTKAMDAIRAVSRDLVKAQPESTWYLTGNDEVRAHIMGMTQRAQESIVIATVSLRGLDIKRVKSADSIRKVLIIPESEEQQPVVKDFVGLGWRVLKTASPMTLAVMDNKEIVVGGATESPHPLALVSNDKSYLQLFHDVIGPRLTIRPPPPSEPRRTPSEV